MRIAALDSPRRTSPRSSICAPVHNRAEHKQIFFPAADSCLCDQLTWDYGREMAEHVQFTIDSGVQVFFCDPRSPWQRGTDENTNGLLRQYLPKGADLRQLDQAALDAIAAELNGRPRQTLGFQTPSQALAAALR